MLKRLLNNVMFGLVVMAGLSCEEEALESSGDLSKVDAAASIDQLVSSMHGDVVSMIESEGVKSLTGLIDLISLDGEFTGRIDGNGQLGSFTKDQLMTRFNRLVGAFLPTKKVGFSNSDEFDFQTNLGLYEWNPDLEEFTKTDDVLDHITVKFPAEGSSINNASLQILNYDQESDRGNEDEVALPTLIVAKLIVDDVLHASLNYDLKRDNDFRITGASVVLFVAPFDYMLEYEFINQTTSKCGSSVSRDNSKFIDNSFTVKFASAAQENVLNMEGYVSYSAYKIEGTIDVASLENEQTESDINQFINLAMLDNGNKIGDIYLEAVPDSEGYEPFILFEDGTRLSLEEKFQPVLDELEELILEIEGES